MGLLNTIRGKLSRNKGGAGPGQLAEDGQGFELEVDDPDTFTDADRRERDEPEPTFEDEAESGSMGDADTQALVSAYEQEDDDELAGSLAQTGDAKKTVVSGLNTKMLAVWGGGALGAATVLVMVAAFYGNASGGAGDDTKKTEAAARAAAAKVRAIGGNSGQNEKAVGDMLENQARRLAESQVTAARAAALASSGAAGTPGALGTDNGPNPAEVGERQSRLLDYMATGKLPTSPSSRDGASGSMASASTKPATGTAKPEVSKSYLRGEVDFNDPLVQERMRAATLNGFQKSKAGGAVVMAGAAPGAQAPLQPQPQSSTTGASAGSELSRFVAKAAAQTSDNYLPQLVQAPVSPFILNEGHPIPVVLLNAVSSEQNGRIEALVTRDVFDTTTGQYLLIPKGSKASGVSSMEVAQGQTRMLASWTSIRFPDNRRLNLLNMPATDSQGRAGVSDLVDNHYMRLFGVSLMGTVLSAGMSYVVDKNQPSGTAGSSPSFGQTVTAQSAAMFGQVGSQVMNKFIDMRPTLELRQGLEMTIHPTKDIVFPAAYKPFAFPTK